MPEATITITDLPGAPGQGRCVTWNIFHESPEGEWQSVPQYPNKTVEVSGAPGAEIRLEGTNGPMRTEGIPLRDDEDHEMIKRAGMYHVALNPLWIRPRLVAGASATVRIVMTH